MIGLISTLLEKVIMSQDKATLRLKKIKLVGFKSFVDPTTAEFPKSLSAIVGPNGCGKSNIIDAVRWVMGEASAKNLRGEAMTDVIFNGSSARKPVGQASVELIFDNPQGALGSEYANYSEIAIKRLVSRDGQSSYFLNGVRCRRKDITDIFLGTGLGPRSYAIIEQGMISKLIEAKPEELRNHLEEVSGISKYKERRRETETRIRHTEENLTRLQDLKQELDKQLETLARQAEAATRYQALCVEEKEQATRLLAIRWRDLSATIEMQQQKIQQLSQELEKVASVYTGLVRDIELAREEQNTRSEVLNRAQSFYYQIGAAVTRAQEEIKRFQERKLQIESDMQSLEVQAKNLASDIRVDEESAALAEHELSELMPQLELVQESETGAQDAHEIAEKLLSSLQHQWEAFTEDSSQRAKQVEVLQAGIVYRDETVNKADKRAGQLLAEKNQLNPELLSRQLEAQSQDIAILDERILVCKEQLETMDEGILAQRDWNKSTVKEIETLQKEYQTLFSQLASLQAIQQVALGRQNEQVVTWLTQYGLEKYPRLAEKLQVAPGWEQAVEVVLGDCLQAVCVEEVDPVAHLLGDFLAGSLTVFSTPALYDPIESNLGSRLLDKVSGEYLPVNLLSQVYITETIQEALALRSQLSAHESVITRDGLWIGPHWIRVQKKIGSEGGMLERRGRIEAMEASIAHLSQKVEEHKLALSQAQESLLDKEDTREQRRRELIRLQNTRSEEVNKRASVQAQWDQMVQRTRAIEHEMQELSKQIDSETGQAREMRAQLQELLDGMAQDIVMRQEIDAKRHQAREDLDKSRKALQEYRLNSQSWRVKVSSLQTKRDTLRQNLVRMQEQLIQQEARIEKLKMEYSGIDAPILEVKEKLNMSLEEQVLAQTRMQEASEALNTVLEQIRQSEAQKAVQEKTVQTLRETLQQCQLDQQSLLVRRTTLEEAAVVENIDLSVTAASLSMEEKEEENLYRLEELRSKIKRLGAINLAAIEEYQVQSERKIYMDKQLSDLMEALETLQRAIEKIDHETEHRFKDTYEEVNTTLQRLFPEMFGGGEAFLELVGDNLLDAGVRIMARPPGKKNSSIHLLSGGEKALTAIALVFSLFKLNPAPFCLLDEVDAPLDDTNVERFCRLVKKMSETVQFIFISHNKIAMEMADQLTGVTMKEPGVSRLVSVDINQAAKMVETA